MSQRIQRQRTKGWRMPEGAVYVGRGTRWGNPFAVSSKWPAWRCVEAFRRHLEELAKHHGLDPDYLDRLRDRDLACWCPLDQPCHADVLLELAQ